MKKIIRRRRARNIAEEHDVLPWKLLIIDDEPDIHAATVMALDGFSFADRKLRLLHAYSAAEAREILATHSDIAMAFVDVVMESDDAGLQLVKYIREELNNLMIRLVIRTGQPGVAPERTVIEQFDIDDYKEKTELTVQKLFTSTRGGIKAYRDLMVIENNKKGLELILSGAPELYRIKSLQDFLHGVLTQVIGLCSMGESSLVAGNRRDTTAKMPRVLVVTTGHLTNDLMLFCGTGRYSDVTTVPQDILEYYQQVAKNGNPLTTGKQEKICLPLKAKGQELGFVYLENASALSESDIRLLEVLTHQFSAAFENHQLFNQLEISHNSLVDANNHAIFMLGMASEMKDRETGNHINRIIYYTEAIARQMGVPNGQANAFGMSSMLHDLGKLGIPDRIIQKPGRLNDDEFKIVKSHPDLALKILGDNKWFELAREIAHCHHEKWDGSGYPGGLTGEDIPFAARIVAIADVWDALISERPYKQPWPMQEAIAEIKRSSGTHFDPAVVEAFVFLYEAGEIQKISAQFPST